MIIFISNPMLIPIIEQNFNKKAAVFNLTSLYSGYDSVSELATNMYNMNNTGLPTNIYIDTVEFDRQYANAIYNNYQMFEAFMKIVITSYIGDNIAIVLVYRDPYRDAIMESLIKLIQERYGYKSWIVEDVEDISCISEPFFTPIGILNMDNDIRMYDDLYRSGKVSTNFVKNICVE